YWSDQVPAVCVHFCKPPPATVRSSATYSVLASAKKKPYGLRPVTALKPGSRVVVWPLVVGSPVPTALMPMFEPLADEVYNCPLKMPMTRVFVTVVDNCVPGPVVPNWV